MSERCLCLCDTFSGHPGISFNAFLSCCEIFGSISEIFVVFDSCWLRIRWGSYSSSIRWALNVDASEIWLQQLRPLESFMESGQIMIFHLDFPKILHQLIGSSSHYLQGLIRPRCRISEPSTVTVPKLGAQLGS